LSFSHKNTQFQKKTFKLEFKKQKYPLFKIGYSSVFSMIATNIAQQISFHKSHRLKPNQFWWKKSIYRYRYPARCIEIYICPSMKIFLWIHHVLLPFRFPIPKKRQANLRRFASNLSLFFANELRTKSHAMLAMLAPKSSIDSYFVERADKVH
jgi:hypothetical protein